MGTPEDVAAEKYFTPPEEETMEEEVKRILEHYFHEELGEGAAQDIAEEICQLFEGYVKLADDQSLPPLYPEVFAEGLKLPSPEEMERIKGAMNWLIQMGWRKVRCFVEAKNPYDCATCESEDCRGCGEHAWQSGFEAGKQEGRREVVDFLELRKTGWFEEGRQLVYISSFSPFSREEWQSLKEGRIPDGA